jgi:molybdopterin/thiamine biosynthesis adenylyltransferase
MLQTTRIDSVIDVPRLRTQCVTLIGAGGGSFLGQQLVRSGVEHVRLVDPQTVDSENIVRQLYRQCDIGSLKVEVTAKAMEAINPDVQVERFPFDTTRLTDDQERAIFHGSDLILALTDNHAAQSTASRMALKYGASFISVGIYPGGVGGEVFSMRANDPVCYRCMFPQRFEKHSLAAATGRILDPASDGASIFVGALIDAIAGEIALAHLTEGIDNRYGRLLERLGKRQLLVIKLDPDWETRPGRDIVRDELGIAPDNAFYCTYNTIAMAPEATAIANPCPDCLAFRPCISRFAPETVRQAADRVA